MPTLYEVLTEWTGPGHSPKVTVMHFLDAANLEDCRAAVGALWESIDPSISDDYSWEVATEGKVINDASGQITDFWSSSTLLTGTGAASGTPLPDAAQALLRWRTATVVAGRRVQGRTYIPGLTAGSLSTTNPGNLIQTTQVQIAAAGEDLIADNVGFVIWSRPGTNRPGSSALVTNASCWNEFATQRRRRG